MKNTLPRSFRLSPLALRLLAQLAKQAGTNKTAVLETLIRQAAQK